MTRLHCAYYPIVFLQVLSMREQAHQASCSAVTASLGLMAGQGMLLAAPLGDRWRDALLSEVAGTVMLGRFQPGTAAAASCM